MAELLSIIIIRVSLCFLAIVLFDLLWQRYSFMKSMHKANVNQKNISSKKATLNLNMNANECIKNFKKKRL